MMYIRFALLVVVAVFVCSCGRNANPHRAPSTPFQIVDKYTRLGDLVDQALFRYEGEAVFLEGEVEIDRKIDQIRIKGYCRSSQGLEAGAWFAMQTYGLGGELLVRNLPRIAFESNDDGGWVVEFDKVYTYKEMGIDSDREAVLIQFNYVQEGEYWYDIKYPEIELPSIVFSHLTPSERFRNLLVPIPLIAPIGIDSFYPGLVAASKTHDGNFDHRASMEIFAMSDGKPKEESRRDLESAISLGGNFRLVVAKVRLGESGKYLVRHGFVWDGVQWYNDKEKLGGFKTLLAVPFWVYLSSLSFVFGFLLYAWKCANRIGIPFAVYVIRVFVGLLGLYTICISMTNVGFWILLLLGIAYFVAGMRILVSARLYFIAFTLFFLLEIYWGWIFSPWLVYRSGILLSVFIYAVVLLPVLWIRNSVISILLIVLGTLCSTCIYFLMSLYADFFDDYPTLKVLGYADQVTNVSDSVWSLMGDSHFSSLVIVIGFVGCLLRAHWIDRKGCHET